MTPLKITLFDPSGTGGVCHYTYQLADQLGRAGHDVTVATTEQYELKQFERHFRLQILFKKSWLKTCWQAVWQAVGGLGQQSQTSPETPLPQAQAPVPNVIHAIPMGSHPLAWLIDRVQAVRSWGTRLKIMAILLFQRPDILHVQWLVEPHADYVLLKILRWGGLRIVYTVHDLLPHDHPTAEHQRIYQKIYTLADRLIVHSERDQTQLIDSFGIVRDKISVIPHGGYDLLAPPSSPSQQQARQSLKLPADKTVLLFFGLIKPYKGLEYLVEAFQLVRSQLQQRAEQQTEQTEQTDSAKSCPAPHLLIVGKLSIEDPDERHRYQDLLKQLEPDPDITCVNAYVPVEDISTYFSATDIVVLPYVKTYTSGILLAAYAAGKPVIVTGTGALGEAVEAGKSGLIVPPCDAQALAAAILTLLHDPAQTAAMGQHAKHLTQTVYSWQQIATQTIQGSYAACLNTQPSRPLRPAPHNPA